MKDLTEHSEEVGNRKLRPKEWVLAKANHADTRGLGKIAPDNFAGRLHVTVSDVHVAQAERLLVVGFNLHGNDRVEIECVVPAEVLVLVHLAIAEGEELHHKVRERLRYVKLCLGRFSVGTVP